MANPVLLSFLWEIDSLHISACLLSTVGDREQPPENLLLTKFISVEQRLWEDLWYTRFWVNESWLDTARYFKMVASQKVLRSLPAGVFCYLGDVSLLAFSLYDEDICGDNGKDEKMKEVVPIAGSMQQN